MALAWNDFNNNGIQDLNELDTKGVTRILQDKNGKISTATTMSSQVYAVLKLTYEE